MDALRRAEQEKKQAAKDKQTQQANDASGNGNNPDASPVSDAHEELGATVKLDRLPLPIAEKQKNAGETAEPVADPLNDLNVDFEKTSPRIKRELVEPPPGSDTDTYDFSVDDTSAQNGEQENLDFSINAEYATEKFEAALSLEPLQDARQPSDDASNPQSADETQPPLASSSVRVGESTVVAGSDPLLALNASEQTLETSSGQTAVAANTVFEAGSSGISKRVILWTLALGIAVIGLLVVSGAYYFQQTPTMRPLPAPAVNISDPAQQDPAKLTAGIAPPTVAETIDPISPTAESLDAAPDELTSDEQESLQTQQGATLTEDLPATPDVTPSAASPEPATATLQGDPKPEDEVSTSDAPSVEPEAALPAQTTSVPTVNTKRLSIARSLRAEKASDKVGQAYTAYQAGNLTAAKVLYEEALAIRGQDTNALNGLAALALHDGNKERAHELYSRVLKLDPNNGTAATAIFQIEGGVGNRVTESQLKLMLDEGGDPGTINFALGALYARHERWNDAQLAYFEAVRHRPNNPDYLFNLAVSLDQIGQRKAALDYYQKALTAADNASAGFDQSQVLSRIQVISAQSASGAQQ